MTGEQVLAHIYNLWIEYQAINNRKPKYLYLSYDDCAELQSTDFYLYNSITASFSSTGKPQVWGMSIVQVDEDDNFIRVGE